jgi:hypothetical protein
MGTWRSGSLAKPPNVKCCCNNEGTTRLYIDDSHRRWHAGGHSRPNSLAANLAISLASTEKAEGKKLTRRRPWEPSFVFRTMTIDQADRQAQTENSDPKLSLRLPLRLLGEARVPAECDGLQTAAFTTCSEGPQSPSGHSCRYPCGMQGRWHNRPRHRRSTCRSRHRCRQDRPRPTAACFAARSPSRSA